MRKTIEQAPFEDIYSFACDLFDKVDIYKNENIQLNLQREQLQQQLLGIQQTILAKGSNAAKEILAATGLEGTGEVGSNLTAAKNLNSQHVTLLAEKTQLEKKIFDLQAQLADILKSKSDTVQELVDLRTKLDEKHRVSIELNNTLNERDKQIDKLKERIVELENANSTLNDEHLALLLTHRGVEKKYQALSVEYEALSRQILALKRQDAERLNAENDKIMQLQNERLKQEIEANVANLDRIQLKNDPAGDNFETLESDELSPMNAPSRIPGDVEFSFEGHVTETCAMHWYACSGPRDDYLATGGNDRKVQIWKIADGDKRNIATLSGSNASITSIDVTIDMLLASSNDYAIRIWSVTDFKSRKTLTGHANKVLAAKFLGFPQKVASGSQDRTVRIWDAVQGSCCKTYFAGSCCHDLVYNNFQVITGHFDGKIRCWDIRRPDNNENAAQIALQNKITSLDLHRDETKVLCSLRDNSIKCLDLRMMEVLQTYSDERFKINADFCRAKFSGDGQFIACGSADGSVYIWDSHTAKVEKVLNGHSHGVIACGWSPDGKRMVSIERGKKINIWV